MFNQTRSKRILNKQYDRDIMYGLKILACNTRNISKFQNGIRNMQTDLTIL